MLREPIPGYTLREQIGSGGSGEVWLADAPGGLKKALKIVYGNVDAAHAERELAALQHIKQVQHPMLLSMERIEVVNNQLMIVSELADGCLKDRFLACIEEGKIGIGREELLRHLTDAADALDFLIRDHNLQHLDVKPENLLLLSNRVKVGDFGLVKDLSDRQSTGVHGLTPVYAPPELFDGNPSRNSDQYSLAIVFQHMLTGELPFAGRNAAQLVAQHLHSTPNLEPLPFYDQPIIERALSKNPLQRFSSCRELVDRLTEAPRKSSSKQIRRQKQSSTLLSTPQLQDRFQSNSTTDFSSGQTHHDDHEVDPPAAAQRNLNLLPPIEETGDRGVRPTLLIGVGGMGARILCRTKELMAQGSISEPVASRIRFLLIDADDDEIHKAQYSADRGSLEPDEAISIPLGQTGEYRNRIEHLTEWINRRWLFAIPRSLKPEGIRPLGRLALIDHFDQVVEGLRTAISGLMTQSADLSGDSAVEPIAPRLYFIGSTCGGTSSGTLIDLAFTARTLLREMGLSDRFVCSLLTHGTQASLDNQDLMIVNTMAFLSEFRYFSDVEHRFPGEPSCGIPRFESESTPFAHTYFVHTGHRIDARQLSDRVDDISHFLLANTAWQAGDTFERIRAEAPAYQKQPHDKVLLRSFAFRRSSEDQVTVKRQILGLTQAYIRNRFLKLDQPSDQASSEISAHEGHWPNDESLRVHIERSRAFLHDARISEDQLRMQAKKLLIRQIGATPNQFFTALYHDQALQSKNKDNLPLCLSDQKIQQLVNSMTFFRGRGEGQHAFNLQSIVMQLMKQAHSGLRAKQYQFLNETLRKPCLHIPGIKVAISEWMEELIALQNAFETKISQKQLEIQTSINESGLSSFAVKSGEDIAETSDRQRLIGFGIRQLDLAIEMILAVQVRCLLDAVRSLDESVQLYERKLSDALERILGHSLASTPLSSGLKPGTVESPTDLFPSLTSNDLDRMEHAVSTCTSDYELPRIESSNSTPESFDRFIEQIQRLASQCVDKCQTTDNTSTACRSSDGKLCDRLAEFESLKKTPFGPLLCEIPDWGGSIRLVECIPDSDSDADAKSATRNSSMVDQIQSIAISDSNVAACVEASRIPVDAILNMLSNGRQDIFEASRRLHTREDIDWHPDPN